MPDYRRIIEERERQTLSPYAALSAETRGREYPIDPALFAPHLYVIATG